jgi:hypothetical protein
VIEGWYRKGGRELGIADGRTGSITAVQRFGSDLALNLHFHMLLLDGCYDALGHFTPIAAPTRAEIETRCTTIAERVQRLLERRALDHDHADERALCQALSRSSARRGADKHAPEGTDPDHDGEPGWKRKARRDRREPPLDPTTAAPRPSTVCSVATATFRSRRGGPVHTDYDLLTDGEGNALTATELPMPPTMLGVARISVLHIVHG